MGKKILIAALALVIVAGGGGTYLYLSKTKADTAQVNNGTRMQVVDSEGNAIKQAVPIEMTFKGKVRVCKVTRVIAKISTCKNETRTFKRVGLTSMDGTYVVSTESYRPLTENEARIVAESLLAEQAQRALNADEKARLDRVIKGALAIKSPTNADVEGLISKEFAGYTPPATGSSKTVATSYPFREAAVTTLAVGGAFSPVGENIAKEILDKTPKIPVGADSAAGKILTGASGVGGGIAAMLANPYVLGGVILAGTIKTKTVEKKFNLLTAEVKTAGDIYKSQPVTLNFTTGYKKDGTISIALNDFDSGFYSSAADQLYNKFISTNTTITDVDKANFKNLLAANVSYLAYARLHGFTEANNNADIAAEIKKIVDNQVSTTTALSVIKNGSFETGQDYWSLDYERYGRLAIFSKAEGQCRTGEKCLGFIFGGTNYPSAYQTLGAIREKGTYKLSAFVKSMKGKGKVGVSFYNATTGEPHDKFVTVDSNWQEISVEMTLNSTDESLWRAYLYPDMANVGSETIFDDVQIVKIN